MRQSIVQSIQSSFGQRWGNLSPGRKLSIGVAIAAAIAGIVGIVLWSSRPDYKVLCSDLSPDGMEAVADEARRAGVPYKQSEDGSAILVPASEVERMRLRLVNRGIPEAANVGIESIVGQSSWATSDFQQQLQYQSALQVELARTIKQITQVSAARVHIVLPRPSAFIEREQPAKASVALKLRPGTRLDMAQVDGIVFLVAGAVEGLQRENVTVIDTSSGKIISTANRDSTVDGSQLRYQQAIEAEREAAIQAIIDPVVGYGNAAVQVSAEIDFGSTKTTSETYTPEGAVPRTETTTEYTSKYAGDLAGAAGVPGVRSSITPNAQADTNWPEYSRSESTTEYEISKTITDTVEQPGKITKLSVAVVVNSNLFDESQLKKIENLVSNAGGMDALRDDITVTGLPFDTSLQQELTEAEKADKRNRLIYTIARAAIGVVIFAFLFFVTRSIIKRRPGPQPDMQALPESIDASMPLMSAENEEIAGDTGMVLPEAETAGSQISEAIQQSAATAPEVNENTQMVMNMLKEDPEKVAQIVRKWLKD